MKMHVFASSFVVLEKRWKPFDGLEEIPVTYLPGFNLATSIIPSQPYST